MVSILRGGGQCGMWCGDGKSGCGKMWGMYGGKMSMNGEVGMWLMVDEICMWCGW